MAHTQSNDAQFLSVTESDAAFADEAETTLKPNCVNIVILVTASTALLSRFSDFVFSIILNIGGFIAQHEMMSVVLNCKRQCLFGVAATAVCLCAFARNAAFKGCWTFTTSNASHTPLNLLSSFSSHALPWEN